MALKGRQITVLGAGIAGLACAVACARRGARVTVLERAPELGEVGAAIQISPNGHAVIAGLGLADRFSRIATPLAQVRLHDYRRAGTIAAVDLCRQPGGNPYPYVSVHRADLVAMLAEAARRLGVNILTGRRVAGVALGFDQVGLAIDGSAQRTARIVIGADGIRSIARDAVEGRAQATFSGMVAWRALVNAAYIPLYDPPPVVDLYMGPGRHCVLYPVRGGRFLNIVAVEARPRWEAAEWSRPGDLAAFLDAFADWPRRLTKLLALSEQLTEWALFTRPVAQSWARGGVVLAGDALHPMLPFQAQGATMALEDAWVLAEALDAHDDPQDAFGAYRAAREGRVRRVVARSRGNARLYHLANPVLRRVAHMGMAAFGGRLPERLNRQFDWIYGHDVTAAPPAEEAGQAGAAGG